MCHIQFFFSHMEVQIISVDTIFSTLKQVQDTICFTWQIVQDTIFSTLQPVQDTIFLEILKSRLQSFWECSRSQSFYENLGYNQIPKVQIKTVQDTIVQVTIPDHLELMRVSRLELKKSNILELAQTFLICSYKNVTLVPCNSPKTIMQIQLFSEQIRLIVCYEYQFV